MAVEQPFVVPVNLNQNELRQAVIQVLASAPTSPAPIAGQVYYDSTLNRLQFYTGTAWIDDSNRATHTGTQTASTISDLATTVKGYSLDQFAAPAADLSINSHKLTNVLTPTNPNDAANKAYVDAAAQTAAAGIQVFMPVQAVATTNVATLSGVSGSIDGVTLTAGMRILLTGQTTSSQNGVYIVSSGSWARPSGTDSPNGELVLGATWFVELGTSYQHTLWILSTPSSGTITAGTTGIGIAQFGATANYTATNGVKLTGNSFSADYGTGLTLNGTSLVVDRTKVPNIFSTSIGDGSSTSYTILHNLGTLDVTVDVYNAPGANGVKVGVNVVKVDTNTIKVNVAVPIGTGASQYRVTVMG